MSYLSNKGEIKHLEELVDRGARTIAELEKSAEKAEADNARLTADCAAKDEALREAKAFLVGAHDPHMMVEQDTALHFVTQALSSGGSAIEDVGKCERK